MNDYLKQRMLDAEGSEGYSTEGMKPSEETPGTFFIALYGKKQTGKDTSAEILIRMLNERGLTVATTAFAEPLKEMCIEILGLERELVYGTNKQKDRLCHIEWDGFPLEVRLKYSTEQLAEDGKDLPRVGQMTVREVLQVMGTDVFRQIYDDVWAQAPFNREWDGVNVVIITDCRFPNEKLVTERNGGVIIRLERETGFEDNHPSEIALDGHMFENTYVNDGSLDDLTNFLRSVIDSNNVGTE